MKEIKSTYSSYTWLLFKRVVRGLTGAAVAVVSIMSFSEPAMGQTTGLQAAYSFDEGAGTSVGDTSGNAHTGTITGATWTTAGRFGGALSFDGANDWVAVSDAAGLDLGTGMTLEAWVYPTASERLAHSDSEGAAGSTGLCPLCA